MVYDPFHPPSFWVRYLIFGCPISVPALLSTFSLPLLFLIHLAALGVITPSVRSGFQPCFHYCALPFYFHLKTSACWKVFNRCGRRVLLFFLTTPGVSFAFRVTDIGLGSLMGFGIYISFWFQAALFGRCDFFVRHGTRKVVLVFKRDLVYSILSVTGIEK